MADDHETLSRIYRDASLSNEGDRPALLARPEVLVLSEDLIGRGHTRVATVDGTIAGFASARPTEPGVAELDDLFVAPEWQRHGVALALVRRLVSEARRQGRTRLEVTANDHAAGFYRAAGFVLDGPTRAEFGEGSRMHLEVAW